MASRLASLRRFSMEQMAHPESVLEHTGFVVLVSAWLAIELRDRGQDVEVGEVMFKALVHDLDELITGDIPRPTKYSSARAVHLFEEIKATSTKKVTAFLGGGAFSGLVEESHASAKTDASGLVVAVADMLAVVYVVWREVILRGNLTMIRQAVTVRSQLDAVAVRIEAEIGSPRARDFLLDVVAEAWSVAAAAAALDDPIHAAMWEK